MTCVTTNAKNVNCKIPRIQNRARLQLYLAWELRCKSMQLQISTLLSTARSVHLVGSAQSGAQSIPGLRDLFIHLKATACAWFVLL